jgi:KaiC/GvpD/RAD55 family RecA-like ATPase
MPAPTIHSVHIYDEHSALISRLCGIVASGLQLGNSVLIVATLAHRDQLVKELNDSGVNVRDCAREGRFVMYDAKQTLASFMLNGRPNRDLFMSTVGKLLDESKKAARGNERGLTVFGEMVAVLWDLDEKEAALELETLWNDALNDRVFQLHCAYPRWSFVNDADDNGLAAVCHTHSHVFVQ